MPYGYLPDPSDDGVRLRQDPEAVKVLRWVMDRVLDGDSVNSIVTQLNESKTLSPYDGLREAKGEPVTGTPWGQKSLHRILRAPLLMGIQTHEGVMVRDEVGDPVRIGPPIVDADEYQRLQEALDARKKSHASRTRTPSPLSGVIVCRACGSNMSRNRTVAQSKNGEKVYYRYVCRKSCPGSTVDAETMETLVNQRWEAADTAERRKILLSAGIKLEAGRSDGVLHTHFYVPPDLRERIG